MITHMTVGDLKKILEERPDEQLVVVDEGEPGRNRQKIYGTANNDEMLVLEL